MAIADAMRRCLQLRRGLLRLNALIDGIGHRRSDCGETISAVAETFDHVGANLGMERSFAVDAVDPNTNATLDGVALRRFTTESYLRHFPEIHLFLGAQLGLRGNGPAARHGVGRIDLPLAWMEMGRSVLGQSHTAKRKNSSRHQDVDYGPHWRSC